MDTLKLATDVWAEFKLISQEANVLWTKILFDNETVLESEYNPNSLPRFYISLGNYAEGLHRFTIQGFTSGNSGSIADKVGVEGFLYEATWPVIIKHNVQQLVNVVDVQYINGVAKVKWEKYDYYGFEFYQLSKFSVIDGNSMVQNITNPKQNYFSEHTYIEGEYASYSVSLNGFHFSNYYFDHPIAVPDVKKADDNTLNVSWEETANPGLLDFYYLTSKAPLGGKNENVKIEPPNITSTTFAAPGFGDKYEIQVRFVPKTYTGPYLNYNSSGGIYNYAMGNKMPPFTRGFKIGDSGEVLLYREGIFYKYNVEKAQATDSLEVEGLTNTDAITISPDGNFFSYFTTDKFVMHETSSWNIVNSFEVPFLSFGNLSLRSISISDNYRLVVVDHFNTMKVIDITTGDEIFRKTNSENEIIFKAVVNGDASKMLYLVYSNSGFEKKLRLADIVGKEIINKGDILTDNYDYKTWFEFAGNEIVILKNTSSYNYTGEIRNNEDFSLIKELKFPDRFVPVALDAQKKQAILKYGYSGGHDYSYAVDINSGELQKIVPIVGDNHFVILGFAKAGYLFDLGGKYHLSSSKDYKSSQKIPWSGFRVSFGLEQKCPIQRKE